MLVLINITKRSAVKSSLKKVKTDSANYIQFNGRAFQMLRAIWQINSKYNSLVIQKGEVIDNTPNA